MNNNPRIGNCSGKAYFIDKQGKMVSESIGDENGLGMIKFYRRQCFEDIGGFVRQVMWDGIDGHRCRQLGWIAVSWDEPEIRFIHLRPMGASEKGIITGRMRHGFGQYFMGTGLAYMFASSLYRMTKQPYLVGGFAMLWGYLRSWFMQVPKLNDEELIKFINDYQWACLLKGKIKATAEINQRQEEKWLSRAKRT